MDRTLYTVRSFRWKSKASELTPETFNQLLAFLNSDRDEAGKKYEEIRYRLLKIFTCRRCTDPEDLTDETINRVAMKVQELGRTYVGDPSLYFYGVARRVFLEWVRKTPAPLPLPQVESSDERELEFECLEQCMQKVTPRNRELILEYYREEKGSKIEHRKALANGLGIDMNALRIRAHRIRNFLQTCVFVCVEHNATAATGL